MENVAIIGASHKSERYSHKAQEMLVEYGHNVYPVSPKGGEVLGVTVLTCASEITDAIDTVTLYVGPKHLTPNFWEIVALKPKRIIFNPGTEDQNLISQAKEAGIKVLEACTLVMLRTNQF